MFFIYFWKKYSATVLDSRPVVVQCEDCSQEYYYLHVCTAVGESTAPYLIGVNWAKQRAIDRAKREVRESLDKETKAVPCPWCGSYQGSMLPILRSQRFKPLQFLGKAGVAIGGILGATILLVMLMRSQQPSSDDPGPLFVAGEISAGVLVVGIALLALRGRLNANYNPNDLVTKQERLEYGSQLTITREQAEAHPNWEYRERDGP